MVLVQPGEGKGSAGLSSSLLHSYKVINKEKPGTLRSALGEDGKRQQGINGDKMFALDLRKKLPWEAIPSSRAGYAEVVQSVRKRFSRPDWMQPWLNPALSRMLDVRPSQQEGCFKQHLPVRCH